MSQTYSSEVVDKATRLIMFTLNPRHRPSSNADYFALVKEYKSSRDMQEAAQTIAHAMQVEIRDDPVFLDSTGPIAIPWQDSLFSPKMADFKPAMSVNERLGYGLLFFVVAAYVFPSAEALAEDSQDPATHKIVPKDVARFATETCEALQRTLQNDPHPDENMKRGCEHLLHFRATGKEGDQKNLTYMVGFLLRYYASTGLLLCEEQGRGRDADSAVYRARWHFKLQVRYMVREAAPALSKIFEEARQHRAKEVNHHG